MNEQKIIDWVKNLHILKFKLFKIAYISKYYVSVMELEIVNFKCDILFSKIFLLCLFISQAAYNLHNTEKRAYIFPVHHCVTSSLLKIVSFLELVKCGDIGSLLVFHI